MLERLPAKVTFQNIQYHLYVLEKIEEGLRAVGEGRVVSQKEAERQMDKWIEELSGRTPRSRTLRRSRNPSPGTLRVARRTLSA